MKRPTYTLTSLIKKVFRPGERSLPRSEINQRLMECLRANGYEMDSEEVLTHVLSLEHSPVCVGHTDAIIELTYQPHQLYDLAYRFLRDTHMPKTVEQIVPELRRQTQFSWNQVRRMLELERDLRFVQYQGDKRWYLAEWKVVNDRVYQYALENGLKQMSLRTLSFFLENEVGLSLKDDVFIPDADERFQVNGDIISVLADHADDVEDTRDSSTDPMDVQEAEVHVAEQDEDRPSQEPPMEEDPTDMAYIQESFLAMDEVAAASPAVPEPLRIEEETFMNTAGSQPVTAEVSQLLRHALGRLEERNKQMSVDVVGFFQQSNMQAIEVLMKEKHKNEQLALGLQQLLALAEEQ
ncbi:hypothetical protein [Brevibacillus migulae]|uniref:hypothetical protein n=1 Tax=Brevibacillus migulae TaxID=1644114 RepID=UPI00106E4A82|nr:hypothetical protein [Brevibacillus migulae]